LTNTPGSNTKRFSTSRPPTSSIGGLAQVSLCCSSSCASSLRKAGISVSQPAPKPTQQFQ
jgi:hypothetical protein